MKRALIIGIDERIALTIAQEPGGGGAAAWRLSHQMDSVLRVILSIASPPSNSSVRRNNAAEIITDTAVYPIYEPANESTPYQSYGYVAWIVDTKIESRVAVDERPAYHEANEQPMAHQQREEDGNRKGVAGMGREKAISSASVSIDGIDERAYLRVVCGTPSGHKRFYYRVVDGACQQYTKSGSSQHKEYLACRSVSLPYHIEQCQIERYPRLCRG